MSSLFTGIFPSQQLPQPLQLDLSHSSSSSLGSAKRVKPSHIDLLSKQHLELSSLPYRLTANEGPPSDVGDDEDNTQKIQYLLQDARWDTSNPKWGHIAELLKLECTRGGYPIRMPPSPGQEDRAEEEYFEALAAAKEAARADNRAFTPEPYVLTEQKIDDLWYLPVNEAEYYALRLVRRERAMQLRSSHKFEPEKVTDWMAGVLPPSQEEPPPLVLEPSNKIIAKKRRREKEKEKGKELEVGQRKSKHFPEPVVEVSASKPIRASKSKSKAGPRDSRVTEQEKLPFPIVKHGSMASVTSSKAKAIADVSSSSFTPPSSFPGLPQSTPKQAVTHAKPKRPSPPPIERTGESLEWSSEPPPFPATQDPQPILERKTPERNNTEISSQSIPGLVIAKRAQGDDEAIQRTPSKRQRSEDVQILPLSGGPGAVTPPRSRSPDIRSAALPKPPVPTTPTRSKRLPMLDDLLRNSPIHSPKRRMQKHASKSPDPQPEVRKSATPIPANVSSPVAGPSTSSSRDGLSELRRTPSPSPTKRSFRDLTLSAPSPFEHTAFNPQYTSTAPSTKPSDPIQSWGFGHAATSSGAFVGAPYDSQMEFDLEGAAQRASELLGADVDYVKRFAMNEWVHDD